MVPQQLSSISHTASGASKQQAIDNVRSISQFIRSGGSYLQLRSLLSGYETQTISAVMDAQQKITNTKIEMGYQQDQIRQLEELHKRFPGGNASSQQIIAANNDLNSS